MLFQLCLFEIAFEFLPGGVDKQFSSSSLIIVKIVFDVVIFVVSYVSHNVTDLTISLGTDDEEGNFASFAILDNGDIDLSETLR